MKNILTIEIIMLYLKQVIEKEKPISLQLNHPGNGKDEWTLYVIKEPIERLDIAN